MFYEFRLVILRHIGIMALGIINLGIVIVIKKRILYRLFPQERLFLWIVTIFKLLKLRFITYSNLPTKNPFLNFKKFNQDNLNFHYCEIFICRKCFKNVSKKCECSFNWTNTWKFRSHEIRGGHIITLRDMNGRVIGGAYPLPFCSSLPFVSIKLVR